MIYYVLLLGSPINKFKENINKRIQIYFKKNIKGGMIMKYHNILLAIELNEEGDKKSIEQATELAKQYNAKLTLVHAIEHISSYGAAYGVAVGADIEEMLMESATKEMRKLGKQLNMPKANQIIKFGPAKMVILDEAADINADLIVLGSHGSHGLRLLLGSTANAVLHGAKCDVLAVRLK